MSNPENTQEAMLGNESPSAAPAAEPTQEALVEMMRDPRYWRQRDPEFIARVTAGFKRLYG